MTAVAGALGVALLRMAIGVTADESLSPAESQLTALQTRIAGAADADVAAFDRVMSAYRLPKGSDVERATREQAIAVEFVVATQLPLDLVRDLVEALQVAGELEPRVRRQVYSDVLAGRDLIAGAAWATVRTIDGNIEQLTLLGSTSTHAFVEQRDALVRQLDALT